MDTAHYLLLKYLYFMSNEVDAKIAKVLDLIHFIISGEDSVTKTNDFFLYIYFNKFLISFHS